MSYYSPSIEKLIEAFEKLPSIGNKTAVRLAFYILNCSKQETDEFLSAIVNAKENIVLHAITYQIQIHVAFVQTIQEISLLFVL